MSQIILSNLQENLQQELEFCKKLEKSKITTIENTVVCQACLETTIPKVLFDYSMSPLVLRCSNCGHKSWAHS